MSHYWLLTALPPRPERPERPPRGADEVLARCLPELSERDQAAARALAALYDPALATASVEDWRARHRQAEDAAQHAGRSGLRQWLAFEGALREALAARRVAARGQPREALRPDVADAVARLESLCADAERAPDPIARQRVLDTARLHRLTELAGVDPFGADAVLARIAAALVVDRWDFETCVAGGDERARPERETTT